jgi:hypothetical protein
MPRTDPTLRDAGIELPTLRHGPQDCLGLPPVGDPNDFASRRPVQVLGQPALQFAYSHVHVVILI